MNRSDVINETQSCQLMVIGAGMTGAAAALFAARQGISTVQVGLTGETLYASGLFDLYGVSHGPSRKLIDNPWQGLKQLKKRFPAHPFARLGLDQIRSAMDQLTDFLASAGHPYRGHAHKNVRLITPVGTIKRTFRVPASMWGGVLALDTKAPCLIVDIMGLRGFSARQIVGTLKAHWPGLAAATIDLAWENRLGPKYAEHIARGLAVEQNRLALADAIRPHLRDEPFVGLPAILGIHNALEAWQDLERLLGRKVFEIPTMPPAISGVRLKEIFETRLPQLGITTHFHHRVFDVKPLTDGRFALAVGRSEPESTVVADTLLLATGRFLGKGLAAERHGIREPLLDLPVVQPEDRSGWHRESFLNANGHAINMAGLAVDSHFRPVDARGRVVFPNLYAAGSVLAHQDWVRTKSGTGLAVATAFGAIQALTRNH